jgi:flavin reductase (DIM6/NTAB) family NADH-FMN oxidoreductase RutF
MIVDPATLHPAKLYHYLIGCIVPRPIGWISTISPAGIPNLAPFSYFNGVGVLPPSVCFSPLNRRDGSKKHTILNLQSTPEFVVNVVPDSLSQQMNLSSGDWDYEDSEFARAGLTPATSQKVKPPGVAESPVKLECELMQIVEVGAGPLGANLVIGKIVLMHIDESVLDPAGEIDPRKLDLIGRMGGDYYTRTRDLFEIHRPPQERA